MKDSLENQVGKFRREEGFQNSNDIYDLTGLNESAKGPERMELLQVATDFTADMQKLLKNRLDALMAEVETQKATTPIPPAILAYMEKTEMNLAQFSMFWGDRAVSKTIEYGLDEMKDENGLMIIFNLPKPIGQFWWKGGAGLWGEEAIDVDGRVIEWGFLYRKLMETVWETIGYYESETSLNLRRLNAIGDHDPKNFYYVWEVSLRQDTV
ncbi:MAG: hypothetical protein WC250_03500 [Candidatus Paceibacterota bacterium]|jgi:hypothetical protein